MMLAIDAGLQVYFAEHDVFEVIKDRCMKKDFSWTKSALAYMKMYSDICGNGSDPNVTFQDAYEAMEVVYRDLEPIRKKYLKKLPDDYLNVCQIRIEGPGEGTFYVKFTKSGMEMAPYSYEGADATISATFDNLYNMAIGTANADRLFVHGQLKVEGNLSKGAEMSVLIGQKKR
jgi:putative sterol carrier protein